MDSDRIDDSQTGNQFRLGPKLSDAAMSGINKRKANAESEKIKAIQRGQRGTITAVVWFVVAMLIQKSVTDLVELFHPDPAWERFTFHFGIAIIGMCFATWWSAREIAIHVMEEQAAKLEDEYHPEVGANGTGTSGQPLRRRRMVPRNVYGEQKAPSVFPSQNTKVYSRPSSANASVHHGPGGGPEHRLSSNR